ncbi:MAG: AAA family ATPase [Gammaproteobacteria bacterium]|nr:AAA family ATPase [Gammaproteobacteria bacterium]
MKIYISKSLSIAGYEGFHLVQDHIGTNFENPWDDFGYKVTFKLYHVSKGESNKVGTLKLLINGQKYTASYLYEKGEPLSKKIFDVTEVIGELEAVSLGESIDYYQKLSFVLGENQNKVDSLLSHLHDASYLIENTVKFTKFDGYDETIGRDGETTKSLIRKGYHVALGTYETETIFNLQLDEPLETMDPIEFRFNTSKEIAKTNINLLIGENGAGKSYVLKRITEVISGVHKNSHSWPFFHKLIVTAYSPFESFYTKTQLLDLLDKKHDQPKRKRKSKDRRNIQINKYAYIGFKDNRSNFNLDWPKESSVKSIKSIMKYDREENWWNEDTRLKTLKDTLSLCMDFDDVAVKLISTGEYYKINGHKIKSFNERKEDFDEKAGLFFLKNEKPISLSSGQEIFSYMIPSLVAEIEDESLIIIDEPELYLHPTLEVALINMLKKLLGETKSSAIIATHSPLIAREVARDGIVILKNKNGYTSAVKPEIQTFGESLEIIIGEAFEDFHTDKPFQSEIDQLKQKEGLDNIESMLSKYSTKIGDEALAYLFASEVDDNIDFEVK